MNCRAQVKMNNRRVIFFFLLLTLASPGLAWSNDERSYPSNDATQDEEENENENDDKNQIKVQSSAFQLKLYHPWTTEPMLRRITIEATRQIVETVLDEILDDHFARSYLSLPSPIGGQVRFGQFQSIEVDMLAADELDTIFDESTGADDAPQCPCSAIPLQATAHFTLISAISPPFGNRRVKENDGNHQVDDNRDLTVFLDDLIYSLVGIVSPGALLLESRLQTATAFFSEGQGFAARIIQPIDSKKDSDESTYVQPTSMPTSMPTTTRAAQQAPPLRPSPAPTPNSDLINGAISAPTPQSKGSGERAIFLVGAILGACFIAAAFLLLRKADIRRSIVHHHKSPHVPSGSIEEVEFYPNHLRPTPSSYTSKYTEKDNKPSLLPGCMSMEPSPEYLFNDPIVPNAHSETTPKASNKATATKMPRPPSDDSVGALSPPFIKPQRDLFEVKSLDDLDPLQPPSTVFAERQCQVSGQLQASSASFSILDSVWSSFDGWSTCSSWPSAASPSSENPPPTGENSPVSPSGSSSCEAAAQGAEAETSTPSANNAQGRSIGIDPPGTLGTAVPNDDGSFHGSVESFDSLISSCWDPNDNSTGDAVPKGSGLATESSSTTSALADDVSFYPHVKFMSNPKMLRWAERARKSLAAVNATKVVSSGSSVESLVTSAADQMASDEKLSGEHPYLSVSFSNSTESSFDENGFKVVNNSSTVV